MKVVINRVLRGDTMILPMEPRPEAFFADDGLQAGFALGTVPGDMDYAWTQEYNLEEYLLCAMYEGGEFCGVHHNYDEDDLIEFTWALLPERPEDRQHIENVVLMYGRAAKLKKLKEDLS